MKILPTRKEILEALKPFLRSNPLIDKRFTDILNRLAQCIQYEIDHNVFIWHMYAKGEEIPSELKDVFVPFEEYNEFMPMYHPDDMRGEVKFLILDFFRLLFKLLDGIKYETEGYNCWGAQEDFFIIEDKSEGLEINLLEYEKVLKKYSIE